MENATFFCYICYVPTQAGFVFAPVLYFKIPCLKRSFVIFYDKLSKSAFVFYCQIC